MPTSVSAWIMYGGVVPSCIMVGELVAASVPSGVTVLKSRLHVLFIISGISVVSGEEPPRTID